MRNRISVILKAAIVVAICIGVLQFLLPQRRAVVPQSSLADHLPQVILFNNINSNVTADRSNDPLQRRHDESPDVDESQAHDPQPVPPGLQDSGTQRQLASNKDLGHTAHNNQEAQHLESNDAADITPHEQAETTQPTPVHMSNAEIPKPAPGLKRYASCEGSELPENTFKTCKGKSLEAGYVLAIQTWEQQTAGSANFMSLQCWAATMNMVVVEPITDRNSWHVPRLMVSKPNMTTNVYGATLSDIFDFEQWNKYSRDKCYSPIVKWKDFLCHAPRQTILVHITYSSFVNPDEVAQCRPEELRDYKEKFSHFFDTHGFDIVRQVCIHQQSQHLTAKTFNEYILGDYISSPDPVTVIIDQWRGAEGGGSGRTGISGTHCGRGAYLSLPFAKPSPRMLAEIKLLQEKLLHNKEYIAVMVRNEYAVKSLIRRPRDTWSYDACLAGVISAWKDLKAKHPELEETFWSFDASKYGTTELFKRARLEYNTFMIQHMNMSYERFEDTLVEMGGLPVGSYIAALEQHMSARAKCLLMVGGGSFQAHAGGLYRGHHSGSQCLVQFGSSWHVDKCTIK